jgi:ABC-type nitrate/sulfonate/bicarbonate transport system permease component
VATFVEREQLPRAVVARRSILSRDRLFQLVFVALFLGVWEYVGQRQGDFFLAPPTSVAGALADVVSSGEIWDAAGSTAVGIGVGFVIAAVLGVALGTLMGTYRTAATTLNPFVSAGYVIPEAAMVPLLIIWFGLGVTPRIIAVVLFAVFEITVSTYAGVRNVDSSLVEVARSFGASRRQLFRRVVLMAALPYIFAGLRMGAARAVKGMVVAELLFAATGVGGAIQEAANAYRTDKVMVYVIVITVMGIAFAGLVQVIERWWMRSWHDQYAERS